MTPPKPVIPTTVIFNYYSLEETLTHTKSLKLNHYTGENVTYFCAEILVVAESLESNGDFKYENLGHITLIFEDTYDSRLRIWLIHKYKQVTGFIKKLCVCDMDVIPPEDIIYYESLVQEATR